MTGDNVTVNFSHSLPFEGEFFAIFTLWGWILCIFHPLSVNSMQFLPINCEFFAFFTLSGWILCNFQPSRVNSLPFSLSKGEFFVFFTLQGWNLCNFYLHEIFFWWKGQKNYSFNGEFFEILVFILVIGVFLSGILGVCCFYTNHPFFGVLCWHFLSFKRVFFTIFTFWGFFAMKMDKTFSCNGECFKILIFV